jgi:hypothetical protein
MRICIYVCTYVCFMYVYVCMHACTPMYVCVCAICVCAFCVCVRECGVDLRVDAVVLPAMSCVCVYGVYACTHACPAREHARTRTRNIVCTRSVDGSAAAAGERVA